MKIPLEKRRLLPYLTRFTCLTCGSTMHQCGVCRRYLCLCTTKEFHLEYDMDGVVCDVCEKQEWPTTSGDPWDDEFKSIDVGE